MSDALKLSDIPGLGPVRRAALADAGVTDLEGLLRMKVAELAAVNGVGLWQARKIREFLRQRGLLLEDAGAEGDSGPIRVTEPRTLEDAVAVAQAAQVLQTQSEVEAQLQEEVSTLAQVLEEARLEAKLEQSDALEDEEAAILAQAGPVGAGAAAAGAPARKRERGKDAKSGKRGKGGKDTADGKDGKSKKSARVPEQVPEEELAGEAEDPGAGVEAGAGAEEHGPEAPEEPGWAEELRASRERLPEMALTLMEAIRQAAVSRQLTRQITRLLITSGEFLNDPQSLSEEHHRRATEILARSERDLFRALEKQSFTTREQKELAERVRKRRKDLETILEQR